MSEQTKKLTKFVNDYVQTTDEVARSLRLVRDKIAKLEITLDKLGEKGRAALKEPEPEMPKELKEALDAVPKDTPEAIPETSTESKPSLGSDSISITAEGEKVAPPSDEEDIH